MTSTEAVLTGKRRRVQELSISDRGMQEWREGRKETVFARMENEGEREGGREVGR